MFERISLASIRKHLLLTALAIGSIGGTFRASAGDFFNDPKSGQVADGPYRQIPTRDNEPSQSAPAASTGRLSIAQIGQLLDTYYPGKNSITDNGDTYYTINISQDTWKFHLIVSLSPNGNVLWVNAPLVSIDDPSKVSAAAMIGLLKKNADLGPIFFQISGDKMLQLTEPISNHDLSAEQFHQTMEQLLATIRKTEPLWNKEVLTPGITPAAETQAAPAVPARNPLSRNPLARNPLAQ